MRRELRKSTGVFLAPEDILGGIRRLLNESALAVMENVRISLPERKKRGRKKKTKQDQKHSDTTNAEISAVKNNHNSEDISINS